MGQQVNEYYTATQISASTLISPGKAVLGTIFVSSASSTPTIKVYDNNAASGTILVDTFTPGAGNTYVFGLKASTGIYVAIGGTVSCTVGWEPR